MLPAGVIVPVDASIVKPAVEVKEPPCVPVIVTFVAASDVQRAGYVMVAVGVPLTVTVAVVIKVPQPPVDGIVYFIVYVPAVAPEGLISPVVALTGKPVGDTE